MGLLTNTLRKDEESKTWNNANQYAAPTGFTAFDVMCTSLERGIYESNNVLNGGVFGRPYSGVGESNVGKTSLWIQIMGAATDYYTKIYGPYVDFVMYDVEKHTTIERIKALNKWSDIDVLQKLKFVNEKLTIEEIFTDIQRICDIKEKNKNLTWIPSPLVNVDGNRHHQYYPTFVLIDSIAALRDFKDFEHDVKGEIKDTKEIVGNIDAMRNAKKNTAFIFQVKQLCTEYNINIVMINHTTEEAAMGPFDKPKKYLLHLKAGEKLTGGKELIYQSAFMTKLFYGKKIDDDNDIYGDYVRGSVNKFTYIKNKNGKENIMFPMIFDTATGYLPELSDFETILEYKYGFSGASAYYLDILPEVKLTRRTALEICHKSPLVARAIQFTAKCLLYPMLVFGTTPVNIATMVENMPIEDRISMILHFTVDYPGYENRGFIVTQEEINSYTNGKYPMLEFTERICKALNSLAIHKINMYNRGYHMQDRGFGIWDIMKNNINKHNLIV